MFVSQYYRIKMSRVPDSTDSYLYNGTWEEVDPQHFLPLVATVIPSHSILYSNAEYSLERAQKSLRKTTALLDNYLND